MNLKVHTRRSLVLLRESRLRGGDMFVVETSEDPTLVGRIGIYLNSKDCAWLYNGEVFSIMSDQFRRLGRVQLLEPGDTVEVLK